MENAADQGARLIGGNFRLFRTPGTAVRSGVNLVKVVGVNGHFLCLMPLSDGQQQNGPAFWIHGNNIANLELLESQSKPY